MPANPVIVVPGIIATYLRDLYTIPSEIIWSVLKTDYERAALHPDHVREKVSLAAPAYEAVEPARIVPDQLYEIAYREVIEELRFNLKTKDDDPVPVYSFGYDWRQPLESIQAELARFIEEVIGRTALMRNYHQADYAKNPKVNLLGHSMGGLVIAGYLSTHGKDKRVAKVATLGAPFRGSFEAVIKVTTGTANLGATPPSSREREAARMTPALYYLVPSFERGLEVAPNLPKSLWDPGLWQPSILETIAEYIRLHGRERMNATERREMAREIFAAMLAAAAKHRKVLDSLDLGVAGLTSKDWLCVIGVDATTRVRLQVIRSGQNPEFSFRNADRDNGWENENQELRRGTGDGTVPFEGAIPKFLPYESLVCVSPKDFGYWEEIGDRAAVAVAGFHGMLPNMNMLQRMVVRFFTGRGDPHNNTWGAPPPGLTVPWDPPLSLTAK
jgi:pimeloyl-ACP methyl ester carboxylesterase